MFVFVIGAFGFLLYIGFLLAVLVLAGIVWSLSHLGLGVTALIERAGQKKAITPKRNPPQVQRTVPRTAPPRAAPPVQAKTQPAPSPAPQQTPASDIWPKWTPSRRNYVDNELALWQEQFDALASRR